MSNYQELYEGVSSDLQSYWSAKAAENVTWIHKWNTVIQGGFASLDTKWFTGGKLNVCYNCVDRHLEKHANDTAIIWEGNEVDNTQYITYQELYYEICKFANVLKASGIKKGDRVCIYLPMIPEAIIAMLACARVGAIHSVVFAGFSAESLRARILDADCKLVITADASIRGTKNIPLKANVDAALSEAENVQHVIVVKHTDLDINWNADRDKWYHSEMQTVELECPIEPMSATDPLFILYTSGSTGKPKGILHTCGGYLVYVTTTFKQVFAYQSGEVYWCTADIGWITGHSYLVYGPLANSATIVMHDGVPSYPTYSRFWEIIDKHRVNIFYTSPTALRALRKEGDEYLASTDRGSLRVLGVVGEPLNPDVWEWFFTKVGMENCPIVNTWWQTETGGIMLSPLPDKNIKAPGAVGLPILGIDADIINDEGISVLHDKQVGKLVIKQPWPGMMQTVYGDHKRFADIYFSECPGVYYTGDNAYSDSEGNFWITGRNDDVIKVSGHRLGTGEIESAFVSHPDVAEAAVVGVKHPIKGEAIYAYITLQKDSVASRELNKVLTQYIRDKVGPFAMPDTIQWTKDLPKTRSGKIMRRVLRKIANNELGDLGDLSTLADPSVVQAIIEDKS